MDIARGAWPQPPPPPPQEEQERLDVVDRRPKLKNIPGRPIGERADSPNEMCASQPASEPTLRIHQHD